MTAQGLFGGVGAAGMDAKAVAAAKGGLIGKALEGVNGTMGSKVAEASMRALQTVTTGTVNSTINAVTYSAAEEGGGWSFNNKGFTAGIQSALVSAGAGILQGVTSGLLGEVNLTDGDKDSLNGHTFDTKSIQSLNNFAGSLAGAGLTYAATGEVTLNVLNLGFLAGKEDSALNRLLSTGLLEMHLGGENGFGMNIGTGGTDVSIGTVSAAVAGLKDAGKVTAAKLEALLGKTEKLSTLSAINKLGWTGNGLNQEIAKAVWDGELDLEYGDIKGKGEYQRDGGKVIISKDLLGGGKEGSAKLATVLAHEGTHVAGNRIEGIAHLQGSGTYQAITAMFGLQGDDAFRGEMDAAISDPESWKENTGNIDHWERVQRADGTYGALPDGNHSLLDKNGNVLIKSPLDIFDENGKIIGHEIETENSYKRSFGMLTGLYPDFIQNDRTYEEYAAYVDAALADESDSMLRTGINAAMANKAGDGSIDVNAYLMTLVGVATGTGVHSSVETMYNGTVLHTTVVDVRNEKNELVGTIGKSFFESSTREGETDYTMIENMIPEGRRLKAATFQFSSDGSVAMFGLGSTMPDPNKMEANPALADGTYRQNTSLHNLSDPYKALRLFDAVAGKNATAGDVIGSNQTTTAIPGFPYGTGDWNKYRQNLPGYNYDAMGNKVAGPASDINVHMSNNNPYAESKLGSGGNYGGSDGCMLWHPSIYDRILGNQSYGTLGNFTINRSFFGDGTGGKNNYLNW